MNDEQDNMQGWAYQQELECQQWLSENCTEGQRCDSEPSSYENIRGE